MTQNSKSRLLAQLPVGWANWAVREACRYAGGSFISWAEPAPESLSEARYAVAQDASGGVRWWRFSPNPALSPQQSSGCFYGAAALGDAVAAALEHKRKMGDLA